MTDPLLRVRDLVVRFDTEHGPLRPLDGVSLDVGKGTTVALIGESGAGKSLLGLSVPRLLASPPAITERGSILLDGKDLVVASERELETLRGGSIGVIFQEPMSSLNPVRRVGAQVEEAIRLHQRLGRGDLRRRVLELLSDVGVPAPDERRSDPPHELSAGLRQRVMITMAIACRPALLIADEPMSALDAASKVQILDLFRRLQRETGMAMLFISHDLHVVKELATDVVVLHAGQVVESGPVGALFTHPLHPYTRALLASIPRGRAERPGGRPQRLPTLEGRPPDLTNPPLGCRFAERCALRAERPAGHERCLTDPPPLALTPDGRRHRCHYGGVPQ